MAFYISKIVIKNIRCFEHLEIEPGRFKGNPPWTMLVGDNATGKTTLLRCIAMGLCDESSAAGLLRESDEGIIRRGREEEEAKIEIELVDPQNFKEEYRLTTTINKIKRNGTSFERVRQATVPIKEFPWEKIFVCGYGAGRGTSGTADIAGYAPINAVYNLFNYSEGLQNPELTLHRSGETGKYDECLEILGNLIFRGIKPFKMDEGGLGASGDWGRVMPLRDLADGFKSYFLWVTDFLGWVISHSPKEQPLAEAQGIVIIDEIEQHLHPNWQRSIINDLRKAFPKMQFISSTHSPLVAASVGGLDDNKDDILFRLLLDIKNRVVMGEDIETIEELDAVEALASSAFGLREDLAITVKKYLNEIETLHQLGLDRTPSDDVRLELLKKYFSDKDFGFGETELERRIEKEYFDKLVKSIDEEIKKVKS